MKRRRRHRKWLGTKHAVGETMILSSLLPWAFCEAFGEACVVPGPPSLGAERCQ